ncbi:MAG: Holliday junction branch migration protein RuvA [Bdellovibrionaceae bacterium]|nr:Holliday junction branch migration protein RuvA [Pseudobdellovibrionaceae bacterium]
MIGFLRGEVVELQPEYFILDVQGVGYEIYASLQTIAQISENMNKTISMWIYTHVREDALTLFGFQYREEKNLFLSLLKVNGVGPKMAIGILSGAPYDKLVELIENSDAKALSQLPRVGKKTAEQIILSLKGKLVRVQEKAVETSQQRQQVSSALVNLGFKPQLVDEYVSQLPKELSVEDSIRGGLAKLTQV